MYSLETISFAFIRPLLEYADVIWDNCSHYEKDKLEKSKSKQLQYLQGLPNLFPSILFVKKYGGINFKRKRRDNHKLTLFLQNVE